MTSESRPDRCEPAAAQRPDSEQDDTAWLLSSLRESEPGKGARFDLSFPLESPE